jgi:iron complex outermembrane receptor protein
VATSYDVTERVTAFVGFSDAFEPQVGFTRGGAAIGAVEGRSVEAGVKALFADGQVLWSNSVFQIDQDNIATADPSNDGNESFVIPLGAARVRGFESELVGSLTEDLETAAGLALLQSEITESADGFESNRFANTPDIQASFVANYTWTAAGLPDLTTSFGVLYVGDREANSANDFELPAYALVNVGAEYALTDRVAVTGYVENLLDETYYTAMQDSGSGADQIAVGDRRLISIGLRVTF